MYWRIMLRFVNFSFEYYFVETKIETQRSCRFSINVNGTNRQTVLSLEKRACVFIAQEDIDSIMYF